MPNAYTDKTNSKNQSKSQQQPAEKLNVKPVDPTATIEQLRNEAEQMASALNAAGNNYAAQAVLRHTQEFTEAVNKLSDLYQIILNPEARELMAVIQAGKAINNEQGLPLQVSVSLGKFPMSNPITAQLGGQYSFNRFYSQSSQSDSQQLLGANSESQS